MKLNRAQDYYKNDKKDYEREQEINTEIYLKKKKKNTDIITYLKKNQTSRH